MQELYSTGISLLNISAKVYGRFVIQRVINEPENINGETQCRFLCGKGCAAQITVFILHQLTEKAYKKQQQPYLCFTDLEENIC